MEVVMPPPRASTLWVPIPPVALLVVPPPPQIGFTGRSIPIPPARTSLLTIRWFPADIEAMTRADPVALGFENERLRRLLTAAYHDMESERVRNAQNVASYEAELAYHRQQRRMEE